MNISTSEINYYNRRTQNSIDKYTECLERYSSLFEDAISLKSELPIFLDTNILIRYYNISFTAREKLLDFIKSNKERIILTSQVQIEFIRNREDNIQNFFEKVTSKIPKDFKTDVLNKMKSFLDTHKVILKDYPFVEEGIEKHQKELEELFEKLNQTADEKRKDRTSIIVKDEFLELLNQCKTYENLLESEIEIIKKDFDALKKTVSNEKPESIFNKANAAFPGLGDIKEKPEDPYGDYIIFHEMMKFMAINKTDVIFLTLDNTKGDWMSKAHVPYLHYVQNAYSNTNQILYIVDAERTLEEILNVNIQSLVEAENNDLQTSDITVNSLTELTQRNLIFKNIEKSPFSDIIVNELLLAGYNSISEIEHDLNRGQLAIKEYVKKRGQLSTVGVMRVTLRIVNPNYTHYFNNSNEVFELPTIKYYEEFRHFVMI